MKSVLCLVLVIFMASACRDTIRQDAEGVSPRGAARTECERRGGIPFYASRDGSEWNSTGQQFCLSPALK